MEISIKMLKKSSVMLKEFITNMSDFTLFVNFQIVNFLNLMNFIIYLRTIKNYFYTLIIFILNLFMGNRTDKIKEETP